DGLKRPAGGSAGAGHAGPSVRGLPRGRRGDGERPDAGVRGPPRRARRARRGRGRALPPLRAPARARRRLIHAPRPRPRFSGPRRGNCDAFAHRMNELDAVYAFLVGAAVAGELTPLVARFATRTGMV